VKSLTNLLVRAATNSKMSRSAYHCVQAVGFLIVSLFSAAESVQLQDSTDAIDRACSIYCTGEILNTVQLSGIYNDSKIFPDMPMKFDPEVVQTNFDAIANKTDITQLQSFLDANFDEAGSDLETYIPPDLQTNPDFLDYIQNADYREWAADLNQRWGSLGKKLSASVATNPERHSFVPINYPMIVPGGRFRESYYWDSWWILKGLLVCDMADSALNVVSILLDQVAEFGYVPNGGRIYYLDRSQPPVLSEMVLDMCVYYKWTADQAGSLLTTALPLLEAEYSWWMDPGNNHVISGLVSQQDGSGSFTLNKYHSSGTTPRPESYKEDSEDGDTATFWNNVRTGAETGWDFSSRWIGGDGHSVRNIAATGKEPTAMAAIFS
jgi:alpha,alpha-trehalase